VKCEVYTDAPAEVWVEFDDEGDGACSAGPARESSHSWASPGGFGGGPPSPGTPVMYYMQLDTPYCWRPWAKAGAAPPVNGGWRTVASGGAVTTGSLLPTELSMMTIAESGEPGNVENVLLNYACHGATEDKYDWLVVLAADPALADTPEARVRWYEDPYTTIGADVEITGLNVAEEEGTVLALLKHNYVVEYAGSGNVQRLYCRDPNGGTDSCVNTSVVADAYFDEYVHHDVMRSGNNTIVLTAEQGERSDDADCDDDGNFTEMKDMVIDGWKAWSTSDDTLVQSWTVLDSFSPSFLDEGCEPKPGAGATECDSDLYWDNELYGCDWAHTNSIWESEYGWLLSWKSWDRLVLLSQFSGSWVTAFTLDGSDNTGSVDLTSDGFHEQHAASGDVDSILLFDNDTQPGPGTNESRVIEMDVDVGGGEATIVASYVMKDLGGNPVQCYTGGAATHVPPPLTGDDTVLAFCVGPDGDGPLDDDDLADDPLFNEFDIGGDEPRWTMSLGCESEFETIDPRQTASYRGYANAFLE
jgi:hypothetical protein